MLAYTDFQDGGQAQINGILLTGGFAVHDGDLRLEHCTFTNMQSEDGFNLKNGHIFMNDCLWPTMPATVSISTLSQEKCETVNS